MGLSDLEGIRVLRALEEVSYFNENMEGVSQMSALNQTESKSEFIPQRRKKKSSEENRKYLAA